MGTSIKVGVNYFKSTNAIKAIIILVCDQPTLSKEILTNLIKKQNETSKPIVAAQYANTIGTPALFTSAVFDQLLSLQDDQGAKKIILQHQNDMSFIDFPTGEIDLDTKIMTTS
jgi:CTP:molybdopterin cytidylyltransferase MocA